MGVMKTWLYVYSAVWSHKYSLGDELFFEQHGMLQKYWVEHTFLKTFSF